MRPSARAGRLLAALLCLLLLTACSEPPGEGDWYAAHGGIEPVLMVEGALYRWKLVDGRDIPAGEDGQPQQDVWIPQGYEAAGELGPVSKEAPEADFQMQAGFETSGTVYANPDRPLVIWVFMTTDWLENAFVRFESEELGDHLIRWDGRLFRFPHGAGQPLEALPEGCVSIGTLTFVLPDTLPENDLECNGMTDNFGHTLTGREVFQDPADPDVLYVFETQYWQGGSFPAWEPCRIWEPGDPLYPAEE